MDSRIEEFRHLLPSKFPKNDETIVTYWIDRWVGYKTLLRTHENDTAPMTFADIVKAMKFDLEQKFK